MLLDDDGKVPVHYWSRVVNFGDLLTPWLVEKMTGRQVSDVESRVVPHYVVIGSILGHVRPNSIVWGTGSFGTEETRKICITANYLACRGPLTRNKIQIAGGECPPIYGDPALLVPEFYRPQVEKTHEVGVIIRHSEKRWRKQLRGGSGGIRLIDLKSDDIEGTIDAILSCRNVVSSSLHGLIIADAYGIPNAWLASSTPTGLEFKYWDYLTAVEKPRQPGHFEFDRKGLTAKDVLGGLHFDDRPMQLDLGPLKAANPFGWQPAA